MSSAVAVVYLDVGGPIYDDRVYAQALLEGLRRLGVDAPDGMFRDAYERCRHTQAGFTRPLARRFGVRVEALAEAAAEYWSYPPDSLHADVLPTLERLRGSYRIGILGNQPAATRAALSRDGLAGFVDLWVLSHEVGFSKPDPHIFAHAIRLAECPAPHVAFVGNRLDNDIRPARAAGMRPILLLRGEAPPAPSSDQLAEADVAIQSLDELPGVLDAMGPPVAGVR